MGMPRSVFESRYQIGCRSSATIIGQLQLGKWLGCQAGKHDLRAGNVAHATYDAECYFRHALVVKRVGSVGRLMVVRVPEKACVGKHKRLVALVPERAVVGAANLADRLRQHNGE